MAKDVNKCMFTGRLGAEPEMRFTANGAAVISFRIASNGSRKVGDTYEDVAEWVSIVAWNKLAELCNEYLHKGSRVYIEGRMQTRKWQDKEGNDRYTTEIIAEDVIFLESANRATADDADDAPQPRQQAPAAPQRQDQAPVRQQQQRPTSNAGNSYRATAAARNRPQQIDDEESLPF